MLRVPRRGEILGRALKALLGGTDEGAQEEAGGMTFQPVQYNIHHTGDMVPYKPDLK